MELKVDRPALAGQDIDPNTFQRVWNRVMPEQTALPDNAIPAVPTVLLSNRSCLPSQTARLSSCPLSPTVRLSSCLPFPTVRLSSCLPFPTARLRSCLPFPTVRLSSSPPSLTARYRRSPPSPGVPPVRCAPVWGRRPRGT